MPVVRERPQLCTTIWESSYDIKFGKKSKKVATKRINYFANGLEKETRNRSRKETSVLLLQFRISHNSKFHRITSWSFYEYFQWEINWKQTHTQHTHLLLIPRTKVLYFSVFTLFIVYGIPWDCIAYRLLSLPPSPILFSSIYPWNSVYSFRVD